MEQHLFTIRRQDKALPDPKNLIEILGNSKVCRLAFIDTERNLPYMVPMSYGFDEKENILYFHSAKEGRKIDIIKKKPIVCFEVENLIKIPEFDESDFCRSTQNYKSVIGYGKIEIIEDDNEKFIALKTIVEKQSGKVFQQVKFHEEHFNKLYLIKMKIDQWTAKQSPPPKKE